MIHMVCVGRCVLNRELGSLCDEHSVCVCDGVFDICAHVHTPGATRRGMQASGTVERQPAWLLGETLMYEELTLESGCLTT
jgi:hypothetical protein